MNLVDESTALRARKNKKTKKRQHRACKKESSFTVVARHAKLARSFLVPVLHREEATPLQRYAVLLRSPGDMFVGSLARRIRRAINHFVA